MAREQEQADAAARLRLATTPHALSVAPWRDGRMLIEMSNGIGLLVDARRVEGLEAATAADLAEVEISPSGFGLHFPKLDADIYLPGLLEGRFGSARYMAAAMGAKGGLARTPAKTAAARENGKLGGRPRKTSAR